MIAAHAQNRKWNYYHVTLILFILVSCSLTFQEVGHILLLLFFVIIFDIILLFKMFFFICLIIYFEIGDLFIEHVLPVGWSVIN